jgi:small subunit ribosomal protein S11
VVKEKQIKNNMGKKRIIQKGNVAEEGISSAAKHSLSKRKISEGSVRVQSTYNNTLISITDLNGGVILASSAGSMGFRGAKKGTPYAATKVAEFLGERMKVIGMQDINIIVKGVGVGREAAIRSFSAQGFAVSAIRDITPVPHNGPKSAKPRRV